MRQTTCANGTVPRGLSPMSACKRAKREARPRVGLASNNLGRERTLQLLFPRKIPVAGNVQNSRLTEVNLHAANCPGPPALSLDTAFSPADPDNPDNPHFSAPRRAWSFLHGKEFNEQVANLLSWCAGRFVYQPYVCLGFARLNEAATSCPVWECACVSRLPGSCRPIGGVAGNPGTPPT